MMILQAFVFMAVVPRFMRVIQFFAVSRDTADKPRYDSRLSYDCIKFKALAVHHHRENINQENNQ